MTNPPQLPQPRTIRVNTPSRTYDAMVGPGLLWQLGARVRSVFADNARAFVFLDKGVPRKTADAALASLRSASIESSQLSILPSEPGKSLETLGAMLGALTGARHERTQPIIAIGGGILGDIAGFAAATYRRGVPWINCPTTLLAMVDASVGGKTAVNISSGGSLKKNMAGVFHQPSLVLADTTALASLPARVYRSGLAECVKHGLIGADWGDAGLLDWIEAHADVILGQEPATLTELIARNIAIKARVVAGDEREEATESFGGRAVLNLGHTFAHAIEPLPGLSPDGDPGHAPLQHGEAVALGLIAACAAAAHPSIRFAEPALCDRVRLLLTRLGLPTRIGRLPPDADLIAAMAHDKKVAGGKLRVVLPVAGGGCRVVTDPPPEAIRFGWVGIRKD